jgi:hypothetical protein
MTATLVDRTQFPRANVRSRTIDTTWTLYAVLAASASIVVGLIWDISWHRTVGRDTFWTYPHVLEQFAATLAGVSCGWLVLRTTFAGDDAARGSAVRFWGFRGPLGAWVCIWGTILMIASAPFDDWWHNAYGLDVKIVSPPHMVLALGMVAIEVGALLMVLAAQRQAATAEDQHRLDLSYSLAGGILITMIATLIMQYAAAANRMHSALFYEVTGAVFPVFLVAFARASRVAWPATRTAAVYMGIVLVMMWTLQLFPATPKLAPIYNPVTHMVPPFFPLLLVFPAAALDAELRRTGASARKDAALGVDTARSGGDWLLALVLGISFVAVMVLVHWFWSEFMLTAWARNFVFAADQWDYNYLVRSWRYQYWGLDGPHRTFALLPFARGLGVATLLAAASARVGLWWGDGMSRVTR